MKNVIQDEALPLKIEMHFPGLAFDRNQKKRIDTLTTEISEQVFITPRIPKSEVIELQLKSDLLLMVAHTNIKGVPSSKLFEYIGLNRPILVIPSDNDIIHDIVQNSKSGYCVKTKDECTTLLKSLIQKKQNNESLMPQRNESAAKQYTRQHQTKVLADALDELSQAK